MLYKYYVTYVTLCRPYIRPFFTIINIAQVALRDFKIHPAFSTRPRRKSGVQLLENIIFTLETLRRAAYPTIFDERRRTKRHVNNDSFRVTKFRADNTRALSRSRALHTSIVSSIPSTSFEEDKVSRELNILERKFRERREEGRMERENQDSLEYFLEPGTMDDF